MRLTLRRSVASTTNESILYFCTGDPVDGQLLDLDDEGDCLRASSSNAGYKIENEKCDDDNKIVCVKGKIL